MELTDLCVGIVDGGVRIHHFIVIVIAIVDVAGGGSEARFFVEIDGVGFERGIGKFKDHVSFEVIDAVIAFQLSVGVKGNDRFALWGVGAGDMHAEIGLLDGLLVAEIGRGGRCGAGGNGSVCFRHAGCRCLVCCLLCCSAEFR